MDRRTFLECAGAALLLPPPAPGADLSGPDPKLRSRASFDFDWKFFRGDARGAELAAFDTAAWRDVHLPHDWSIEGPFDKDAPSGGSGGYSPCGAGWYRKEFVLPAAGRDRTVWIEFDGVYHNSDVWINGKHLGARPYGYVSFHYDLTPHLAFGASNVLAVRVDNSDQPNCRWYSGSGIYRHVWLTQTSAVHVAHWGTSVTTPKISAETAEVCVRTRVRSRGAAASFRLETTIHDRDGRQLGAERTAGTTGAQVSQVFTLPRPLLWSLEDPALYYARSVVFVDGQAVDDYVTWFGIREVRFDKDKGFLLNGRAVKMKGVCLHHDAGAVGAAVPDRVLQRRLEILKSIGCNAIRCSHNPPAPELLDFCDRMGFVVIDEAFDKWAGKEDPRQWWMKSPSFPNWWQQDLRSMLERDRNHPCVVLWSVGNETGEPGTDEVNPTLKTLVDFVHREEPARPVTCALILPHGKTLEDRVSQVLASSKLMDVAGLNYQEPLYPHLKKADPNLVIVGTEAFKYWRNSEQLRHAFDPANTWWDVLKYDYVAGQFLWTGIDYLGESGAWPDRGSTSGIIDTCGFLKPEGWFQRSAWRADPVVFLSVLDESLGSGMPASSWEAPTMLPHWNFQKRQGQLLRLQTQTNCETVELVLNGVSYGERRSAGFLNRAVIWHVPWQPGRIEAVGRNDGRIVARHELRTSGPCARIALRPDREKLASDGRDISHIEVQLTDGEGVLVPDDDRAIQFEMSGPGVIIGVDNGDLRSLEPYKGLSRTTRAGRCLVMVQSARNPGVIHLAATATGLPTASVAIQTG
ncbi:MAG: glycoside hydrolase family 2 TIM barrel-domain containing protein [Bryobacteraceae bacterium]|jgi:beta-galactosidase